MSGRAMSEGHFLLQALHPVIQFSLFLLREKRGITGRMENTAPMGQSTLQKNLSLKNMPVMINNNTISPAV